MKYTVYDHEQGTEEWLEARAGKVTASMFSTAISRLKSGGMAKQAIDYAHRVAHERIGGSALGGNYTTWQMERGTELEWEARAGYEVKTGGLVNESGLIVAEGGMFGYSSDGLVGDDGLIEIKTPASPAVLSELIINKSFTQYMAQIQGGLWITGRQWCDLVIYAPQLKSIGKDLNVYRIKRDDTYIFEMELRLLEFAALVLDIEKQLRAA